MSKQNNRELLELAAKAAGLQYVKPLPEYDGSLGLEVGSDNPMRCRTWNPLTDDGDALRLLVRLGLSVDVVLDKGEARTISADASVNICGHVLHNNDPQQATRLAIVCAAALLADSGAVADGYKR